MGWEKSQRAYYSSSSVGWKWRRHADLLWFLFMTVTGLTSLVGIVERTVCRATGGGFECIWCTLCWHYNNVCLTTCHSRSIFLFFSYLPTRNTKIKHGLPQITCDSRGCRKTTTSFVIQNYITRKRNIFNWLFSTMSHQSELFIHFFRLHRLEDLLDSLFSRLINMFPRLRFVWKERCSLFSTITYI